MRVERKAGINVWDLGHDEEIARPRSRGSRSSLPWLGTCSGQLGKEGEVTQAPWRWRKIQTNGIQKAVGSRLYQLDVAVPNCIGQNAHKIEKPDSSSRL